MDDRNLSYVLITPARNEEVNIERTIASVLSQTVLPTKWVIVSDGSTDRTDEIVNKYLSSNSSVELIRLLGHKDRNFASKVHCFNAGYEKVKDLQFDIIVNLDADISFDEDYLEFLVEKFSKNHNLGVAGTPFIEDGYNSTTDSFEGEKHVAGGCQLFRRECFEEIGGYIPIKDGIDWVAVTTARMKGWRTQSFKEKYFHHYRKLGTGQSNKVAALFKYGTKDYTLGGHPLWELFRVIYQMTKKPYIYGGIVLLAGYLWALLTMDRPISRELIAFHRQEQIHKLKLIMKSILKFRKIDKFNLENNG